MKGTFIFAFLLAFVIIQVVCDDQTLYVSSTGSVNSTSCSSDDPCLTLQAALNAVSNSTTEVSIQMEGGVYSGNMNTGCDISMPDISVTIENWSNGNSDSDVVFQCSPQETGISASTDLQLNDLTFQDCSVGISFFGEDQDLTLDDIDFARGETAIFFSGDDLNIDSCTFTNGTIGVQVTSADTIYFEESKFMGISQTSITVTTNNTVSVDLEDCDFENTGFISFTLQGPMSNDTEEFTMTGCYFENVTGNGVGTFSVVDLSGGMWDIENIEIYNSGMAQDCNAISFSTPSNSQGSYLVLENPNVAACNTALYFNAPLGELQITDGTLNANTKTIQVEEVSEILLSDLNVLGGPTSCVSVDSQNVNKIDFENLSANATGPFIFNLSANTNATITASEFTYSRGRTFDITGGKWTFEGVTMSNQMASVNGSGGAISIASSGYTTLLMNNCDISGSTASENGGAVYADGVAFAISSSTFSDNTATNGGAVFSKNYVAFSVEDSTFTSNYVSNQGGGIALLNVKVANASFAEVDFQDNNATNGAAISCCYQNNPNCNVTLSYENSDSVVLSGNTNRAQNGSDVTCPFDVSGTFSAAASSYDADVTPIDSSSSDWVFWLILSIVILVIIGLVVAAIVGGYFFYKKQRSDYIAVE